MPYLYCTAHPSGIVKVGISQRKHGRKRIRDYTRKHGLPRTGWSSPRHFKLATMAAARLAERLVHVLLSGRRQRRAAPGREVFSRTHSRAHWACLKAARATGAYVEGG